LVRNVEFNKIDNNTKSKLILNPSTGILFENEIKRNSNKIIYKNITRKTTLDYCNSNDSVQIINDINKKNSSNTNISEYLVNNVNINKGKLVTKISRQQSQKNVNEN